MQLRAILLTALLLSGVADTGTVQLQFIITPLSSSIHHLFPLSATAMHFCTLSLRLSSAIPPSRQRSSTATRHATSSSGSLLLQSPLLFQQRGCCPCRTLRRHAKVALSMWAARERLSQRHTFIHPFQKPQQLFQTGDSRSHLHCCSCLNSLKPETSPRSSARDLL